MNTRSVGDVTEFVRAESIFDFSVSTISVRDRAQDPTLSVANTGYISMR